ncbi:hypothetical protein GCM10023319_19720 [Nocardia iowensis]
MPLDDLLSRRSIPWKRRPQASRLLDMLARPDRGFDAVVIGEPQRAFYGNQFGLTFPVFVHYSVQLWVPEVGGPIDPESEAHELIMSVFGGMSKGERNRIKIRVRAAMAAQARVEGRYLGGRPPYGYRLADAGPHPHPGKAADGKRLHILEPDPTTAPVVQRIFREYLNGFGIYAIAQHLTAEDIPCPSAYDRKRNQHRSGVAWSKSAVRVILTNARYTGHEVWNKQRKQESLIDVNDVALGHQTRLTWNPTKDWVHSDQPAHEALISKETFEQTQLRLAARNRRSVRSKVRRQHPYAFKGLLTHETCGRRMQGNWNHDKPTTDAASPPSTPSPTRSTTRQWFTCEKNKSSTPSTFGSPKSFAAIRSNNLSPCSKAPNPTATQQSPPCALSGSHWPTTTANSTATALRSKPAPTLN